MQAGWRRSGALSFRKLCPYGCPWSSIVFWRQEPCAKQFVAHPCHRLCDRSITQFRARNWFHRSQCVFWLALIVWLSALHRHSSARYPATHWQSWLCIARPRRACPVKLNPRRESPATACSRFMGMCPLALRRHVGHSGLRSSCYTDRPAQARGKCSSEFHHGLLLRGSRA